MRLLVIRHHEEDTVGLVGDAFVEYGAQVSECLYPTGGLPDPEDYDCVVVLGANWSVNSSGEIARHTSREVAWLRQLEQRGQPVLGICFGAQLLTVAGGGRVEASPMREIGWARIQPVPEAVLCLEEGPWFQFHSDRCILPDDAHLIADNAVGVQAFVRGTSLGVQFHPEITAEQLSGWLDAGSREDVQSAGIDPGRLVEETASHEEDASERARGLVASFLEEFC